MVATVLDPHVVAAATQSRATLAAINTLIKQGGPVRLMAGDASVEMPPGLLRLLAQCVQSLEQDQPVTLLPMHRMLSLEEAADLLNIPRINARRVLAKAKLPLEEVDGETRIRTDHLLEHYTRRADERRAALAELVRIGQEIQPEPADQ